MRRNKSFKRNNPVNGKYVENNKAVVFRFQTFRRKYLVFNLAVLQLHFIEKCKNLGFKSKLLLSFAVVNVDINDIETAPGSQPGH